MALDNIATARQEIAKIYIAAFNRVPDSAGLDNWYNQYAAGLMTYAQISQDFSNQAEYKITYPAYLTSTEYITKIYTNVFGRTPDAGGLQNWINQIDNSTVSGIDRTTVMKSMLDSATSNAANNDGLRLTNQATFAVQSVVDGVAGTIATAQLGNITFDAATATAATAAVSSSAGTTYTLTVATDSLTGTASNDIFDASGFFNTPTATTVQTLSSTDSLNGGSGTDTLNVILNTATATTLPTALTSIEVINLTNTVGTNVLDLANATGITTLNSNNSATQIAQFNNVQSAVTNFGLTNTAVGMTANIANAALAGTTDAATLTLQSVTAGVVTLQTVTAASGYETLNVVSSGTTANVLTTLTDGTGTSLATINVTGTAAVNLGGALDASVTTVDASTMTAAVTVNASATANVAVTTGTANDTITIGAGYTTADTINGGAGTDTLSVTALMVGGVTTAQTNVSNIETISISNALTAAAFDLTKWNGATNLDVAAASLNNATASFAAGTAGLSYSAASTGSMGVTSAGTAITDVLNWTAGSTAAGNTSNGAFTSSGFETINILSQGSANVLGSIAMAATAATETINITGSQNLTLGAVTADKIDASAFTGVLAMVTGTTAAGGITITGGTAGDTLFGSTSADVINGGAGADNITGAGGADILTGGAGFDTFSFAESVTSAATYTADANITDFTVGTTATTTDFLALSIANTFGAAGNIGLTTGTGLASAAAASAAGATVFQTVAQNAAAAAMVATTDFIKLTTGVAAAATNQLTFDAAIGTGTLTSATTASAYAGMLYDTTNSKAVVFEVLSGANTTVEATDVIRVIGTIDMSAADYANFDTDNVVFF